MMQLEEFPVDLGDGLVMRRATRMDVDRLEAFNARIHGEDPLDAQAVAAWTRDLLTKAHPTVQPEDFLIVEEKGSQEIVSSLVLISQTWSYEGIPFGVGRPELVGTDARYRGRGLVRKQFQILHEWSRQRGELLQAITGIRFFYRQFGYEMGLEVGGGWSGFEPQVPKLAADQPEPYRIRPARETDIPLILRLYNRGRRRSLVSAVRDEALIRHELVEKSAINVNHVGFFIIETPQGHPVGYITHPEFCGAILLVTGYELDAGFSYLAVTPAVIRYLWKTGQELAPQTGAVFSSFRFWLGSAHPAYAGAAGHLVQERMPYAYYVRIPDLPLFLKTIQPALEQRLADSPYAGYSGEIKISFYRDGLRLVFDCGHLATAEAWKPVQSVDEGSAGFPNLTFLQLLLGYRSFADLRYAYADCWAKDETRVLLDVLFPKKSSAVWAIS